MERKTVLNIAICFIVSILFILFLQLNAVGPNQQMNHFVRIFPPHFIGTSKSFDLKNSNYYFAGLTARNIYLGNYGDPEYILKVDLSMLNSEKIKIQIPDSEKVFATVLHWSADSSFLYLNNYALGSVYKISLSRMKDPMSKVGVPAISSLAFLPFSRRSYVIRTFDKRLQENILSRISESTPQISNFDSVLEKQGEGIFSTDGLLRFNPDAARFVYIYFYRNQFITLDTSFKIDFRARTLDTNTEAKIRVISQASRKTSTIASPGFRINRSACTNNEWILINSDLRADNEEKNIFSKFAVIDIYGIGNGHYHFSFYLPKGVGKITDMAMIDNRVITIQDRTLLYYDLNFADIKGKMINHSNP